MIQVRQDIRRQEQVADGDVLFELAFFRYSQTEPRDVPEDSPNYGKRHLAYFVQRVFEYSQNGSYVTIARHVRMADGYWHEHFAYENHPNLDSKVPYVRLDAVFQERFEIPGNELGIFIARYRVFCGVEVPYVHGISTEAPVKRGVRMLPGVL